MSLSEKLDDYGKSGTAWRDPAKRESAAVQRLQRAVAGGNTHDMEKLRQAALAAAEASQQRAASCPAFEFDVASYLSPEGEFLDELQQAAQAAGVRLYERDGVIFCYPVLVRPDAEVGGVRIDKRLEFHIRPETLAAVLKKAQAKEPKAQPDRFIETLLEAYEFVRARRRIEHYVDVPLVRIYEVLTLLPGAEREYTLLDFTRDVYFLDTSARTETKKGYKMSLTAATGPRERGAKAIRFVTRDGQERVFASVRFTPPRTE